MPTKGSGTKIRFEQLEQGLFFRLESPTPQYPDLLISIFEANLPKEMQSETRDEYALFQVIRTDHERITLRSVDHDLPDDVMVVPTRGFRTGMWVVEEYASEQGSKIRTLGMVNEAGAFVPKTREKRRKRRGGRGKKPQ